MSPKPSHPRARAQWTDAITERLARLGVPTEDLARLQNRPDAVTTRALARPRRPLPPSSVGAECKQAGSTAPAREKVPVAPAPPTPGPHRRSPSHARKNTPEQRRRDIRERRTRAEALHQVRAFERWQRFIADGGHDDAGRDLEHIPRIVWERSWQQVSDRTGRAIREGFRREGNTRAKAVIAKAALCIGDDQLARYSWADMRARRIAALGLALLALAKRTRRRDCWGGGIVKGISRGALAALLRDVHEPRAIVDGNGRRRRSKGTPAITTLAGTHRTDGTPQNGQVGYLRALQAAGLFYRQQLPEGVGEPCEFAHGGTHPTNRYWLASAVKTAERFKAWAERFLELSAAVAGAWEHELGIWAPRVPLPPASPPATA